MKHGHTILIVDDTLSGRTLLQRLLAAEGYDLIFANDGIEALTKAIQLRPDLILLDVMMPRMNGFEVCERLRADPLLAKVPIILVTALNDQVARLHGLEVGADDFVTKPFDRAELLTRVRTILRLNRYRQLMLERAKFEWVIENTDDGYLIVNHNDDVLYLNPQARFYLGLPIDPSQPIEEPFLALASAQYQCKPETAWAAWPAQLDEPGPYFLMRPESPSAHAFWLQVDLFPAEPNLSWVIRLRDVTKQIDLQRDMWNFHSMVSHKLRAPLLGMLASVELMAEYAPQLSSEEIAKLSSLTAKSVRRLSEEIQDILQYLDAAKLSQSEADFSLAMFQLLLTQIGAEVDLKVMAVSIQAGLEEARLSLSQRIVELILQEILENAKKFHPQQSPTVEISLARLNANQVCLKVMDDGMTLSPEQLARVWTPYYQGEKYFTGQMAGMGLGLPMVASLVWEKGGTVHLYNREDGPGVVVEVILPLVETASRADEQQ